MIRLFAWFAHMWSLIMQPNTTILLDSAVIQAIPVQ